MHLVEIVWRFPIAVRRRCLSAGAVRPPLGETRCAASPIRKIRSLRKRSAICAEEENDPKRSIRMGRPSMPAARLIRFANPCGVGRPGSLAPGSNW
jgi:hypothetical protein